MLLVASMVLPMAGPLLDHHFAERQPGHKHLGTAFFHRHSYGPDHSHYHGPGPADASGGGSIIVYSYDSGPSVPALGVSDQVSGISTIDFDPSSLFLLPGPPAKIIMGRSMAPPREPPRA